MDSPLAPPGGGGSGSQAIRLLSGGPGACRFKAPPPVMREGLSAACEAARPRLCRFLRRILPPKPTRCLGRARYAARWAVGRRGGRRAPAAAHWAMDAGRSTVRPTEQKQQG